MSYSKNDHKLSDVSLELVANQDDEGDTIIGCNDNESCTYAVTVSKKSSTSGEDDPLLCSGQKSFISIHSTDHLCQVADIDNDANLDECNVEVLSLNEVFPSTSEESLSNEDESHGQRKKKNKGQLQNLEDAKKYLNLTNNKSSVPGGQRGIMDAQAALETPKNTLYVVGSNPGEPKMSYQDPPQKISKTMKKFLRNIDKHKNDQSGEKAISKLTTVRGILKDGRCGPECTGDSSVQDSEDNYSAENISSQLPMNFDFQASYTKPGSDKNVSFNTQVVIIHFTGDLCIGQSIETLSKEKDQQARNSEIKKTFLTKYNEFWPTQK